MATKNAVSIKNGQAAVRKKEKPTTIKDLIKSYEGQFAKALPKVMTPERFARIATTAITQNPELAQCTPSSFMGALLNAAQLGLEPNTPLGQAYLIPFNRSVKDENGQWHKIKECQFQLGYKGLIELAHRSGEMKSIEAHVVYERDEFEFEFGLDPKLKHVPSMDEDRGEITWVYAIYHLVNGGYGFEVMSRAEVNKHRNKYSKAANSPAWKDSWEEMAKKTVVKKALKYAPLKTDFVREMNTDESTMNMVEVEDEVEIIQAPYEVTEAPEEPAEEPSQQSIDMETGEIK